MPTHPLPTRCAFHKTPVGDFGAQWWTLSTSWAPSGAHSLRRIDQLLLLLLLVSGFRFRKYKKNTDLIIFQHTGCFLWPSTLCEEGRQVFGSYQLWNQAPLPPFVCLPPGLNSIDQRLAGLLLQPGSEAAKKPWLASTTNRQYLFLITQLYFSPQPRVPKRCIACTEHAREYSVFVSH